MSSNKEPLTRDIISDGMLLELEKDIYTEDSKQLGMKAMVDATPVPILFVPTDAPRDYAIRIFRTPFGSRLKIYFSTRSNFVHFAYLDDEDGKFSITSNEIKQMVNADYSDETQEIARKVLKVVDSWAWISFITVLQQIIAHVHADINPLLELDLTGPSSVTAAAGA